MRIRRQLAPYEESVVMHIQRDVIISSLLVKYFESIFQMVSSIPWESSKRNLVTSYGDYWWHEFSGVCMRLELKRIN